MFARKNQSSGVDSAHRPPPTKVAEERETFCACENTLVQLFIGVVDFEVIFGCLSEKFLLDFLNKRFRLDLKKNLLLKMALLTILY